MSIQFEKYALMLFCFGMLTAHPAIAQYSDNPLKGKRWVTVGAGINTADHYSWQGLLSYSKRTENSLLQTRVAYTQELFFDPLDSCTSRINRLSEFAILWGDGWSGRNWYVTGSVGFGFNVRMFCRRTSYEDQYITSLTAGVPVQVELGVNLGKKSGLGLMGVGNWNFRESYAGALLTYYYRLNKLKN
jgi:hypothetical protein